MNNLNSFAHQKNILTLFINKLNELTESLNSLSLNHDQILQNLLEQEGLMEEIYSDYQKEYLVTVKQGIAELIEKIQNQNIPFLEREVDFISSR